MPWGENSPRTRCGESKLLFEKMYSGLMDAVLIIDSETKTISNCNPASEQVFGYQCDEILQRRPDILFADQRKWDLQAGALNSKDPRRLAKPYYEAEMLRKDGSGFFAEYSLLPLEDEFGLINSWVMIVRDITERKNAEETLRISQERYMLAMQGANDGLWDWNLETDEAHFSSRWKAMLGYQIDEISESPDEWLTRIHTIDRPRVDIAIDAHLKGASPHLMIEYRIRHKDGSLPLDALPRPRRAR